LFDEKTVQTLGLFEPGRHQGVFPFDPPPAQGALDAFDQLAGVAVFADEFESPLAQGLDRRIDRFVGAEDDDRGGNAVAGQPAHDLDAADVGQLEVEDDDVDVAALQSLQRLLAGAAILDATSVSRQKLAVGDPEARFVIDDQDVLEFREVRNALDGADA